jgi:hypothetical protein
LKRKISFAQAGSFAKITLWVIFIRSVQFHILAFLHFIAALRSKKTGEIWGKKIILQPIEKSQEKFNDYYQGKYKFLK